MGSVARVNRLAEETSPYLRQHRDNPVDWYPWGPEAFAKAAVEDRPVLLSVGYAACHWCHVMAHESFEDAEVAQAMNDRFVSVKVDREERPDVDAVYMDAVQAMTGQGGWPMTVFLTPDGRPFYGGTYYPRAGFLQLLAAIDDAWRHRRTDVVAGADQLVQTIDRTAHLTPPPDLPGAEHLSAALQQLASAFDTEWGGFGRPPKFPQAANLELVLRASEAGAGAAARRVVTETLDAMASGGIYDHLGGGFARYSVDRQWLVPHFEKMLYDQALLIPVYLHAWQVTGEERYRQVVDETVTYVLRDLRHGAGGFFSSEDADSEGEEGRFYVWTPAEMTAALGPELVASALDWFGVTEDGNFEGRNILHRPTRGDLLRPPPIEAARTVLLAARGERVRPGLDDKVLTEWNGLFLAALAESAAALRRSDWLAAAKEAGEFLLTQLRRDDGRWHRSWQAEGGARHDALAADHAALLGAFVRLSEATGETRWIAAASATADTMLEHFWDHANGGVFTTADDGEALIVRQKDLMDGATPAANSLAANGLYRLGALTGERRYTERADDILRLVGGVVAGAPTAFGHLLGAVDLRRTGVTEIAVVGDRPDLVAAILSRYLPNAVLAWGEPYPSPLWEARRPGRAYVCRDYACQAPAESVDALVGQLARAAARTTAESADEVQPSTQAPCSLKGFPKRSRRQRCAERCGSARSGWWRSPPRWAWWPVGAAAARPGRVRPARSAPSAAGTPAGTGAGGSTPGSVTVDTNFTGEGSDELCSYLKDVEASGALDSSSLTKEGFAKLKDVLSKAQDKAPDEIKPDIEVYAKTIASLQTIYEKYNYDATKISAAAATDPDVQNAVKTLSGPDFQAALGRLGAYSQQVCGITASS